ncbi:hypothetical protein [Hymenobacter weizhouensis]|uniref:hypothetical protein n=1 Tax=Hymenobacter sp. YIM 151500-1 TaxID=2987689 RepID=UPI00222797A6|nr:hypothetical protein [Hymenobacter sp. YIM 151500-1]UYZ62839.1 hypothetical protein OIS53_17800 [Hymenobacter sp. YIM 151500-1]
MKLRFLLLLPALCVLPFAAATQTAPPAVVRPVSLAALPEGTWQPVATSTILAAPATTSTRFQYQLLKVEDDEQAFLAPAWRGHTQLAPEQKNLFGRPKAGELDALVMQALNDLAAEGWELLEVYHLTQPVRATQKIETDLTFNNPNRPNYTGNTSIQSHTETRYLFRRPLAK